jgi:galactokinase
LRRAACEEGVRLLSRYLGPIKALREVTTEQLEAKRRKLPELIYRRCRHIVTENARVLEAERALEAGDLAACGRAMNASHVSMQKDFEITCPEVDMLVGLAQTVKGVYGSRMTGGGFGGCTVSLVEASAVEKASHILTDGYRIGIGRDVELFVCAPSDGAGLISV